MKFLITLAYYRRPKMVLNALQSINELKWDNFELVFIDDSGDDSFREEFAKYMKPEVRAKSKYIAIMQDELTKLNSHGSIHGKIMNESIQNSDADILVVLCDDDALVPDYFSRLDAFYTLNSEINYAYSYVYFFDPVLQHYKEGSERPRFFHHGSTYTLNEHKQPIPPVCQVDSSQVTFRTSAMKEKEIWYPWPRTRGLDAAIFNQFYANFGLCHPTGFFGQYKGAFSDQLGNRGYDFNVKAK